MQRDDDRHPWLTPEFEGKFRQAFGREMSNDERRFFGFKGTSTSSGETCLDEEEEGK